MPITSPPSLHEEHSHGTESFRCGHYSTGDAPSFFVSPHWHEELEIIYFERGQFALEINMEHFPIDTECLFFVRSGELHRITSDGPCRESAVVFSPYLLGFVSNDAAQSQIILPLARQDLLLPRCICSDHPAFASIYTQYHALTTHCEAGYLCTPPSASQQLRIKAALLNMLALLSEYKLLQHTREPDNATIESVKNVLTYIHEHYAEKITVSDLAALPALNEQYFCRFFRKAVGQSPIAYLNGYRIRHACSLLLSTNLSVTEVCLACGFNNFGNFLREFRLHTGTTPLKYRQSNPDKKSI